MITHSFLFDSLIPSPIKYVQVANGTPMLISGAKNVSLSPTISRSSILFSPNLSNSLFSISKITKHIKYSITFYLTHYVFQDNLMKMMIGIGKGRGGLHYLEGAR